MAKPPSSGSTAHSVNVYIDDRFASQLTSLSQSVDGRISAMSEGLLFKFSDMLGQFKLDMSNISFAAEPEVSGRTPISGQSLPLRRPVRTDIHPHQFQGTTEGPMPCGSGYAHLGKSCTLPARSAVGVESEQPQDSLGEDAEAAQAPEASSKPRVSFVSVEQDPEDER